MELDGDIPFNPLTSDEGARLHGVNVATPPLTSGDPAARTPPPDAPDDAVERDTGSYGVAGDYIPTREQVRAARQRETSVGFEYPLPFTGGTARVRALSIVDRATIKALPTAIQDDLAAEMTKRSGSGRQVDAQVIKSMLSTLENQERIANAFCVLGFLQPSVVATEDDLNPDDPYQIVVTDLHIEERVGYLQHCLHVETVQAGRLRRFRR